MTEKKVCSRCKKEKKSEEFISDNGRTLRTCNFCRGQMKSWHDRNKDRVKEWGEKNKEKRKKQRAEWVKDNPEYSAQWIRNNRERTHEYRVKKASYNVYASRLVIDESPKKDSDGNMLVKCFRCGKYFYPTRKAVKSRIASLEGKQPGESHLYCSEECKSACPIYGVQKYIGKKYPQKLSRDMVWVKMVLERDGHTCVKCGATTNLQAHHIIPVSVESIFSADIDNGVTLCKECHEKAHEKADCRVSELAKISRC